MTMDAVNFLLAQIKPGADGTARARHRRSQLPCTTDRTPVGPLIRQLLAATAAEMKDKSYRASPVGETVGRYLQAIQYAGLERNTLESYEQVLAWLALAHDDLPGVHAFCDHTDALDDFLYLNWGTKSENTRVHRYRVLNAFFKWCGEKDLVPFNPMQTIRKPRSPRNIRERQSYEQGIVQRLINAQEPLRDRCALGLLRLAIRKNDLRMMRLRDLDMVMDVLRLNYAKGGKRHQLPIVFDDLRGDLAAHLLERGLERGGDPADEYLLYPKGDRGRPMTPSAVHRWFKRCLSNAGLSDTIQMHELRHTAADHMWRHTGNIILAQMLLRHESPATTAAYLHPSDDDLRAGLKLVQKAWRQ